LNKFTIGLLSSVLISTPLWAGSDYSNWSDKTVCRLIKSTQSVEYANIALQRGLSCAGAVSVDQVDKALVPKRHDYAGHTVLSATDVSSKTVKLVEKWLTVAENSWFTKSDAAKDLYGPIIITIAGTSGKAGEVLEQEFCELVKSEYPKGYPYTKCAQTNQSGCTGACFIADYARLGGASITGSRIQEGFHLMIMAGKYPAPKEEDYKKTVLHEAFHIFQLSHIGRPGHQHFLETMGRATGGYNKDVPWWSEGVAEYMALALYSRQPRVSSRYLREQMGYKLDYHGSGSAPVIREYLRAGGQLYNYDYSNESQFGTRLGPWFAAYLVSNEGEQKIFDFYANVEELGFESSFVQNFGKPYRDYVADFDLFIDQPMSKLLKIIP